MVETKLFDSDMYSGRIRMRQGGDPDDWSVPGTTNYVEEKVNTFKQMGAATSTSGTVSITFPTAFDNVPLVNASLVGSSLGAPSIVSTTTTGFQFKVSNLLGILTAGIQVNWTAEGRRPMP